VSKTRDGIVDLAVRTKDADFGRQFSVEAVGIASRWGSDLMKIVQRSAGTSSARIPKDAPAGAYRVTPYDADECFVLVERRVPTVLYAPQYWMLPDLTPPVRVYFELPDDAKGARIFFEGSARLFGPKGRPFGEKDGMRGWVDLPSDRPGLWSFLPIENRLVRGMNFPPFFAFGDPAFYFSPPVPWERQEVGPPPQPMPKDVDFVTGAILQKGDQAVRLGPGRKQTLTVEAGPAHPSGDGGLFLPRRAGTIEFLFKPDWGTFDLGPGAARRYFMRVQTDKGAWGFMYRVDPEGVNINLAPKVPSHSFYGAMLLENNARLRVWRTQSLLERQEWAHIAWSWGPETVYGPHQEKLSLMVMRIFLNGKGAKRVIFRRSVDQLAKGSPERLMLYPLDGAVDELRISDVQRYRDDFKPPTREKVFRLDAHTRALFHFNGDFKGLSHGTDAEPVGVLGH
jgi:hypothetical protein